MEAYACPQAVAFAEEMGFREVDIEGDSLKIVKKLVSHELDRSISGNIILEIKERIHSFWSIEFRQKPRLGNDVAHELAQWGRLSDSPRYWMEDVRAEIELLVPVEKKRVTSRGWW